MSDLFGSTQNTDTNQKQIENYGNIVRNVIRNSHERAYNSFWIMLALLLLCITVSMGLLGGVWGSVQDFSRSDSFKVYSYSIWGLLGGSVLILCLLGYFHHSNMEDLKNKTVKGIDAVFEKKSDPFSF
jgi:hypothetical protein